VRTSAFTQRSTPNVKSIDSSSNPQEHIWWPSCTRGTQTFRFTGWTWALS
jgi:hypothetical protein